MTTLCPLGVIQYAGDIVTYERVPEWGEHGKTGRQVLEARIFGRAALLELTPELVEAIEADEKRKVSK